MNLIVVPIKLYPTDIHEYERDLYYTAMNLGKKQQYRSVAIGGSGVSAAIYFDEYTMRINPNGISPIELYDLLKYFLELHPECKVIYVALEFNTYFTCFHQYTIPKRPTNAFEDFLRLYFSYEATKTSFQNIIDSITPNKQQIDTKISAGSEKGKGRFFISLPYLKIQYEEICEYDNIAAFKKIYDLIQEKNLYALYFIPPVHALYLTDCVHFNYLKNIETFKKEIAKITPYWDFSFINKWTTLPIGYLFLDAYHINGSFVSNKIKNIIYGYEVDDSVAMYVTKNNVDSILKKQSELLNDYIKNNKDYIEHRNNSESETTHIKTYLKNFPEYLKQMYREN